jgi:S-(hydroxymethyl)glutathione dehydrogenase / alcohol dehydrogenase
VIGCGGVGLSAIQGAVLSSAYPLIAVDVLDNKLELARALGATHTLNAQRDNVQAAVRDLTQGRGVDYSFEAIGLTHTIEQAYEAIRPGGTAVVVGQVPEGHRISIDPYAMSDREKTLKGSNYGSCRPSVDFPKFVDLYLAGKLKLDEMISRTIRLDEVNAAFDAMMAGDVVRSVIRYGVQA